MVPGLRRVTGLGKVRRARTSDTGTLDTSCWPTVSSGGTGPVQYCRVSGRPQMMHRTSGGCTGRQGGSRGELLDLLQLQGGV